jgi:hypothetical protein
MFAHPVDLTSPQRAYFGAPFAIAFMQLRWCLLPCAHWERELTMLAPEMEARKDGEDRENHSKQER